MNRYAFGVASLVGVLFGAVSLTHHFPMLTEMATAYSTWLLLYSQEGRHD